MRRNSSFCMWKKDPFNCSLDLIDNGSNIKVKEALYQQSLHYAYSTGHLPIVEYFIEKGSYIEAKSQCHI